MRQIMTTNIFDERYRVTDMVHGSGVTAQIVQTVAESMNRDVSTLPPLYDQIDPDALDQLFDRVGTSEVAVEFRYAGCDITISATQGEPIILVDRTDSLRH